MFRGCALAGALGQARLVFGPVFIVASGGYSGARSSSEKEGVVAKKSAKKATKKRAVKATKKKSPVRKPKKATKRKTKKKASQSSQAIPKVQSDFYKKLRARMKKWVESKAGGSHKFVEILMFAPDLFWLLCKLVIDPRVPTMEKVKLVALIAYFISPIDLMPEALLGPVGYADDIVLTCIVLNGLVNKVDKALVQQHWPGDGDVLDVIKSVLAVADGLVGKGLFKNLKRIFVK